MPRRLAALLCAPVLLLGACSGGASPQPSTPTPTPASGIPSAWLDDTADGWPDSASHGSSVPILNGDECLLTEELTANGATGRIEMSGWGAYGDDPSADDAYRYLCDFDGEGLTARLQLIQAGSSSDAEQTVAHFLDQGTSRDQQNTPSTVQVGDADVAVNLRWYPKPEYGEATAVFHDVDADALVQLEVTSLDEDAFAAYTAQDVADDLMAQLGRS